MNSIRLLLIFSCIVGLSACKKEKLEGDAAILIGTWEWTESYEVRNYCESDSLWNYMLVDQTGSNNKHSLEFLEKGKVIFRNNDKLIWNQRVVFESQSPVENGPYEYHFVILPNNNSNDPMNVWVGQDSLLLNDFPKDTDDNCAEMFNHFIRM